MRMLISTLPSANKTDLVEKMYSHPLIDGARYNTGIRTTYSPFSVLDHLKNIADRHNKKLWVDLKGRQLRITNWADPTYGDIELNRKFKVNLPARIYFRGNHWSNIIDVNGRKIVVDPDPKYALGAGQAINVIGTNLRIKGDYLLPSDREYIEAAVKLGMHDYMLSFIEHESDLDEVRALDPAANLVLKIENLNGLGYVREKYSASPNVRLMAARDDLMINIGDNKSNMLGALELILEKDPGAIVASHIFNSIPSLGYLTMADISDVKMLHGMGYKNFMFSDDVAQKCFDEAMKAWEDFRQVYHE